MRHSSRLAGGLLLLLFLVAGCSTSGVSGTGSFAAAAENALEAGRSDEAVRLYEAAAAESPASFPAWIGLARASAHQGDQRRFGHAILKATALARSGDARDLEAIGRVYLEAARVFAARPESEMYLRLSITHYRTALSIEPAFEHGWYHLGLAQYLARDRVASRRSLERELTLDAGFGEAQVLYARILKEGGDRERLPAFVEELEKRGLKSDGLRVFLDGTSGPESPETRGVR